MTIIVFDNNSIFFGFNRQFRISIREPKVDNFNIFIAIKKHIFRFQISMNNTKSM